MSDFSLHSLHSALRKSRPPHKAFAATSRKKYARFPQTTLPACEYSSAPLVDALAQRRSARQFSTKPISLQALSNILGHALALHSDGHAPYPSGGSRYPIETYILSERVTSLDRNAYHYRPDTHSLETLPAHMSDVHFHSTIHHELAANSAALIILTAVWQRTASKYNAFGFELGLMEAGHVSQALALCAHTFGVASIPLASFREDVIESALDLDPVHEQVVLCIALGTPPAP